MATNIRKSYLDTALGQIHVRSLAAAHGDEKPPLLCLHPSPYSGAYFETVMPLLNDGRRVIAADYPGYGGSYRLDQPPSIADYAQANIDSVLADESGEQLDLLGFHSGCLVAAEIALTRTGADTASAADRRAVLRSRYAEEVLLAQVAAPLALSTRPARVLEQGLGLQRRRVAKILSRSDRALEMFVDQRDFRRQRLLLLSRRVYVRLHENGFLHSWRFRPRSLPLSLRITASYSWLQPKPIDSR